MTMVLINCCPCNSKADPPESTLLMNIIPLRSKQNVGTLQVYNEYLTNQVKHLLIECI